MKPAIATASLRKIPSVDKVVGEIGGCDLPRPVIVDVVRHELGLLRTEKKIPNFGGVMSRVRTAIDALQLSRIQPVINGTGIVIHTNFGRAPLSPALIESLTAIGPSYTNLEYDLTSGERGHRATYLEHNLALLCEAEATTVVNNCAAALILILRHFTAKKKEVVISRSELIQIGGGFRIPEILEASGAKLREIGTTNKTSVKDYARVLGRDSALRCDKLILTALQTTVDLYLAGKSSELPVLAILDVTSDELRIRAELLLQQVRDLPLHAAVGEGKAQIGGGSLPRSVIPSVTLDLRPKTISLENLATRLRRGTPPIVGYIAGGKFKLDLRTIFPRQDAGVVSALRTAQWN